MESTASCAWSWKEMSFAPAHVYVPGSQKALEIPHRLSACVLCPQFCLWQQVAGRYFVHATLSGVHVCGSPMRLLVIAAAACASASQVVSGAAMSLVAGESKLLLIQASCPPAAARKSGPSHLLRA
eukprot:3262822-Pleurochrysis_carterae.AAC.1